ncbi:ankyrin repeat domain-containing protein [Litoribacillus peritrichatus]|uniref:Ankyrin repeat domain-containing protein n=1 Tax=Litoribacillus peritrichatus TaxID=718191 RepID=A0ABP7N7C8_9GAMM
MKLSTKYSGKLLVFVFVLLSYGCASGPDPQSASTSERPALHEAALISDVNGMEKLLMSGAGPNEPDNSNFTPLHWAAASQMGKNREMIELLVQYGADPNLTLNNAKMVPLQFAATADTALSLIENGAKVNHKDISQGTPLHNANKPGVAQVLLENGANPEATNALGQTPAESLKSALSHFGKEAIYNTPRQQYQQTIAVIENYQMHSAASFTASSEALNGKGLTTDTAMNKTVASQPAKNSNATAVDERDFETIQQEAKQLGDNQVCAMQSYDWYYTGNSCLNDFAHGNGAAINPYDQERFEGLIQAGYPIKGRLLKLDQPVFEGEFEEGLAHGDGVCFFEGAPEACQYYKGDRIDALHKQRLEFQRQQELLSQAKKAEPPVTTHHSNYVSPQPNYDTSGGDAHGYGAPNYNAQRYDASYTEPEGTAEETVTDSITDTIQDEMIDRGAKYLFDELF